MRRLNILIADDEPLARRRIRQLLETAQDHALVGESCSGHETVEAIRREKPDLVFLDVQMPDLNAFQVLERLGIQNLPEIIFVTAYEEYALKAFDVHAVDYLLKPFDDERFLQALERALERIESGSSRTLQIDSMSRAYSGQDGERHPAARRLLVKSRRRTFFVDPSDVLWVGAEGSYVRLHCKGRSYLLRRTLRSLHEALRSSGFIRIHRSTVINRAYVQEIRPRSHGDYSVILYDGTHLNASRNYRSRLLEKLEEGSAASNPHTSD
ncbi:MAG TPA: LytTR family DNA-binding domain-containing protein [Acidobacteriota bacterium]|nr:LytTR family DNA-binding domain-containing protein [Acidobacteriota bacterium]